MKFTKLSLLGAASAVALTFVAGTNLAIADGHKVKPIKMRWASDHSGPPHPAAIAEVFFAEQVEKKKYLEVKFKFIGLNLFTTFLKELKP
jgi:hypothetical protein